MFKNFTNKFKGKTGNEKFDVEILESDFNNFGDYWDAVCWRNEWARREPAKQRLQNKFGKLGE